MRCPNCDSIEPMIEVLNSAGGDTGQWRCGKCNWYAPPWSMPAPDAVTAALDYASSQQVEDVVWSKLKIAACAAHAATVKELADAKAELTRVSEAGDRLEQNVDKLQFPSLEVRASQLAYREIRGLSPITPPMSAAAYRAAREGRQ
jgi:hypothetical protein